MYPYHNTIKKRIKNGELIGYNFADNYKNIGKCLILHFNKPPFERPIRPHKYSDYVDILVEWEEIRRRKEDKTLIELWNRRADNATD